MQSSDMYRLIGGVLAEISSHRDQEKLLLSQLKQQMLESLGKLQPQKEILRNVRKGLEDLQTEGEFDGDRAREWFEFLEKEINRKKTKDPVQG